jgi:hypothetical protein
MTHGIVELGAVGKRKDLKGICRKQEGRKKSMQDALNTLMLICASLASMAFGVMVAYWICRAGFALLRIHARSVAMGSSSVRVQREPHIARLT